MEKPCNISFNGPIKLNSIFFFSKKSLTNFSFFIDFSQCSIFWIWDLNWEPGDVSPDTMKILPVNFQTDHKQTLSHLHLMITKNYLAIPAKYDKLIISLRTAWARELSLDNYQTSYNDLLDALRLSLKGYQIT